MAICNILIPKLEVGFFDFDPRKDFLPKTTVKALREICKMNDIKQAGLKHEIIQRLQERDLFPKLSGKHEPGPRWFYFDEAFGAGDHILHYMCMCGAPMSLDNISKSNKRIFSIRNDGLLYPSLHCGNDNCRYHIWGKLKDWKDGAKGSQNYFYDYKFRPYNHATDRMNSRIYNSNIR